MPQARSEQVSVDATPYYHVISRCVRQAFLCGEDRLTGQCFDHRKGWLVERMKTLASVFAIDICAYAVMSNHFHLVVRLAPERIDAWDDEQLLKRVKVLFKTQAAAIAALPAKPRREALRAWRERLGDLSWFMRTLNEWIARRANREDGCTGRFWEGRFSSQALLDEGALLACMSYVDLNPVRAGIAETLEDSPFTSIQERLSAAGGAAAAARAARGEANRGRANRGRASRGRASRGPSSGPRADDSPAVGALAPLRGDPGAQRGAARERALPLSLPDYVALLEEVGSAIRDDKPGRLGPNAASTLQRLGLDPDTFVTELRGFGHGFFRLVGATDRLELEKQRLGRQQIKGVRAAQRLYASACAA